MSGFLRGSNTARRTGKTNPSPSENTSSAPELLTTKISAPRLRAPLVERVALFERLDDGLPGKLTVIAAPAGFGKTTLVRAWIADRNLRAAWVSLDENDDDPVRFWRYVMAACQPFTAESNVRALAVLQNPKQPLEAALTLWINELYKLNERLVLVLEDYHVLSSPHVHESVSFLLDHLPPLLHLVLTTRTDPPLALARLRVLDELTELNAADLRFSSAETDTFLQQVVPFQLSAEATSRLQARTEGWAAGLRLASLALQSREDAESFLETFDGSHRHIVEYLIGEVFARQPEAIQQFLLQTAFLSRLNADLCDTITGRDDSDALLDALERSNLFVTTCDGAWYRYHALFAEAMQHYARQTFGDERVRDLYRCASAWYHAHGYMYEAVEAALDAQDYHRAASLIQNWLKPMEGGHGILRLRRMLDRLPEDVLFEYPDVCLIDAVVILFSSDRRAPATGALMRKPLQFAEACYRSEGRMEKVGEVLAFRSLAAWWQEDPSCAFAAAHQAAELLRDDQHEWRSVCEIALGMEHMLDGQLEAARRSLNEGQRLSLLAGNEYGKRAAMGILSDTLRRHGDLHQAEQLLKQMFVEAKDDPTDQDNSLFGLGAIAYEWNDLERAERSVTRALEIAEETCDHEMIARSALLLAQIQMTRGRLTEARRWLGKVEPMPQVWRWSLVAQELHLCRTRLALLSSGMPTLPGDDEWGDQLNLAQQQKAILKTRILLARGKTNEALDLLEQSDPREDTRSEITLLLLKALAFSEIGHLAQAKQALMRALVLAQPGDHRRLFLDEGAALAALLQETIYRISSDLLRNYARRLLTDFAREQPDQAVAPMAEPLSPQERRVLTLLSSGLTNPEIAQELVVSINTVKTQIRSIYRKLNVSSRQQACAAQHGVNVVMQ